MSMAIIVIDTGRGAGWEAKWNGSITLTRPLDGEDDAGQLLEGAAVLHDLADPATCPEDWEGR